MIRNAIRWALVALLIAAPLSIFAGSLRVVPIKVFLDDRSTTASLTLTNEGEENVTVQLHAKSWDQDDQGIDIYAETDDIVFFPKIVTLEPATERIIRVGYQGDSTQGSEKTYRLFVQELPVSDPGEMTLRFAITFSIPIFVMPAVRSRDFSITDVSQERGGLRVAVSNAGKTHVSVEEVRARGLDTAGYQVYSTELRGWYVLSGKTKTYELTIPEDGCSKATAIEVEMKAGGRIVTNRLDANVETCETADDAPDQPGASDVHGM